MSGGVYWPVANVMRGTRPGVRRTGTSFLYTGGRLKGSVLGGGGGALCDVTDFDVVLTDFRIPVSRNKESHN